MKEAPNVLGKNMDDAKKLATDAGYLCVERNVDPAHAVEKDGGVRFNDPSFRKPCAASVAEGTIIEQDPTPGVGRLDSDRGSPVLYVVVAGAHPDFKAPEPPTPPAPPTPPVA